MEAQPPNESYVTATERQQVQFTMGLLSLDTRFRRNNEKNEGSW